MDSFERFRSRLSGRSVDRAPNFDIMMTFAAHHIGQPLRAYYTDHRVLVEANLAVARDFDLDIVQAISDPFREAADMGLRVEFPEDGLPLAPRPLLARAGDLAGLRPLKPEHGPRMSDRLEAVRSFRDKVKGRFPIMGWVEGALAEAADLRGVGTLLTDLIRRPEWVEELLEVCAETAVDFARAQMEAGADIIGLGDAVSSQVSPRMYQRFALPYEQKIFKAVHQMGGVGRLHICGDTTHLLPLMVESGADIIDLDWMVDLAGATAEVQDRAALCGNFDPVGVMLQGTPEEVYQATVRCLETGGERLFSMAGCEIPDGTPAPNLAAQNRALRDQGASQGSS